MKLTQTSQQTKEKWNLWQKITGVGPDDDECDLNNAPAADYLTMYLRWTLRTSFFLLLLSCFLAFFALSLFFAALIYADGKYQPQCLNVQGKNFTAAGAHFRDAYALSWQTLSTVGYGVVYPELPTDDGTMCMGINLFCTIEAFVGLLFVGFMSAILFGKVGRIQSFATVDFSDPIVVRYGTGVMDGDWNDAQSEPSAEIGVSNTKHCPFPILEFRCHNRMHSERGGEILNARVNVVAAVLASKASGSVRSAVQPGAQRNLGQFMPKQLTDMGKAGGKFVTNTAQMVGTAAGKAVPKQVAGIGKAGGRLVTGTAEKVGAVAGRTITAAGQATGMFANATKPTNAYDPDESNPSDHPLEYGLDITNMYTASIIEAIRENQVLDEGSDLVPQRIFCNFEVGTPAHPLFKRVWIFRHTLDQNSPLLSQEARELIAESNGFWPEELNNCRAIRKILHFHEIIVNLSGTGNATGSSVYAQKVYSFDDVHIGYTFVSSLFRRPNGKISVDIELLNDVVEQNGGGGEPFVNVQLSGVVNQVFKMTNDVKKEAQDMAVTATEKVYDMAKDVVSQTAEKATEAGDMAKDVMMQTAEKVTDAGAQFTSVTYGKKDS
jgi:hypothetical protein